MRRAGTTPTVGPLRAVDPRWDLAACRNDPDLHFPKGYVTAASKAQIELARTVCRSCPLTGAYGPCLARATRDEAGRSRSDRHGIFAGTTPSQRHAMDQQAKEVAA